MRFTHFEVTFQQAGICMPPMSLEGRRANAHLLVMFSAWTSQKLIKFSLQVGFRNDLSTTIAVLISGALVRGRLITKSMYTLVTE